MAIDDFDREEIDRLVKELTAPPKPVTLAPPETAAPAADNVALTPGSRWTSARLLMPAERTERRDWRTFASSIGLPELPKIALPALSRIPIARLRRSLYAALPKMTPPKMAKLPTSLAAIDLGALSARFFVGISVLLSAAMPYWPYAHAWSWGLLFYFFAVMLVVIAGIWSAKLTWDARLPAAHTLAVGTIVWGLGLLAAEAVPRIVYA
jgi:hypothetical protein